MDELDASGRQMLVDRPVLTKGRLAVYRDSTSSDDWFPHLSITLKRSGSDITLWKWETHRLPADPEEPPPYSAGGLLEHYFELDLPVRSPRGLEAIFKLGPGATCRGSLEKFSAALYLYPNSLDDRGVQVGVVDFVGGLHVSSTPVFFRFNFPW